MTTRLCFGPFELDEALFQLRRFGQALPVQPKVLDLMLYLVRHRERVVLKQELFERLWPGVTVTEAALSQAVSQARRVLGDDAQRAIQTVHGRGFRFVAALAPEPELPSPRATTPSLDATSQSLQLETSEEQAAEPQGEPTEPHLFVTLHCENPGLGGARIGLAALDELTITRASSRQWSPGPPGSRRATLALPGAAVSRQHARFAATREGWFVIDDASKNGTYVNGVRVARHALNHGDIIECGRTLLVFEEHPTPPESVAYVDSSAMEDDGYTSLLPQLLARRHVLSRIARTTLPMLLGGASGVGKSEAVKALHTHSERTGPLVCVDCGALSAASALSQLFGEASADKAGASLLESAHQGTLCFDRIENLPHNAQVALVRVIETGALLPVGGTRELCIDVRFVATTSVELEEQVALGRFDRELLARLSGFRWQLPSLRERRVDLGWLIGRQLQRNDAVASFTPAAGLALLQHSWRHNRVELGQCLTLAVAEAAGAVIAPAHLHLAQEAWTNAPPGNPPAAIENLEAP